MTFDKWFNKHHAVKTAYGSDYFIGAQRGFEAGQKSKQAEIDALKAQLSKLNDIVHHLKIESSGVHAALRKQQRINKDLLEKLFGVDAGEYVVVPKSPTLKMLKVADKHVMDCNATPESAYKAMIEAAQEQNND